MDDSFNDFDIIAAHNAIYKLMQPIETYRTTGNLPAKTRYICPYCGAGSKQKHTSGIEIHSEGKKGAWVHCFACGRNFDAIQLYRDMHNCSFKEAVISLKNMPSDDPMQQNLLEQPSHQEQAQSKAQENAERIATQIAERRQYLANCFYCLQNSIEAHPAQKYLADQRRLSAGACKILGLGYDLQRQTITIPFWHCVGYTERFMKNTVKRYQNNGSNGLSVNLWQLEAPKAVFVCEGAFDAAAILTCEKPAIALNSCANASKLCDHIEQNRDKIKAKLILALDCDPAGIKTSETISARLSALNVPHLSIADISPQPLEAAWPLKDPNEALLKLGKEVFTSLLQMAENILQTFS